MFLLNFSQEKWLGYYLCKSVASPLLIRLQQGQVHLKGYKPNYIHAKSPVEVKENEAATDDIILLPPKQR